MKTVQRNETVGDGGQMKTHFWFVYQESRAIAMENARCRLLSSSIPYLKYQCSCVYSASSATLCFLFVFVTQDADPRQNFRPIIGSVKRTILVEEWHEELQNRDFQKTRKQNDVLRCVFC